jgi:hypothetical protein
LKKSLPATALRLINEDRRLIEPKKNRSESGEMITRIKSIGNLAVFKDFLWGRSVLDDLGNIRQFSDPNF